MSNTKTNTAGRISINVEGKKRKIRKIFVTIFTKLKSTHDVNVEDKKACAKCFKSKFLPDADKINLLRKMAK